MWDHPNPVFLDFETQSQCDLKEYGSRLYAQHPSTRILIMAVTDGEEYHVWIPSHIRTNLPVLIESRIWPHQLKPSKTVYVHRGDTLPLIIAKWLRLSPVVAHNAFGFDKLIADACLHPVDSKAITWLDSMYVARACGRTGQLDRLAKQIEGIGKDRAKKLMPKLTSASISTDGKAYVYPLILPGDLAAFTTYAIADVELMTKLWHGFDDVTVEVEAINTVNAMNDRGIKVDTHLLRHIEKLSAYSQSQAVKSIVEMTDGRLHEKALRSTKQMHEWLAEYGIDIVDDAGKPCLRKEVVQRYIDSPYILGGIDERGVEHDTHISAVREIPPMVLEVLRLRMKALRITDAKVSRALDRVEKDGRIRNLQSYHVAHTGRLASTGINVHNLPRPMQGMPLEKIVKYLETIDPRSDVAKTFDSIKLLLPSEVSPKVPVLPTVDDVCSALIRPSLVAKDGYLFCISDYSKVEAVCVAWMAEEESLLTAFREGRDVYSEFASYLYGMSLEQVINDMRQVAKVGILGSQYGMGANKFRIYAANAGVDLVKAGITADMVIDKYRDTYQKICGFKPDRNKSYRVNGLWQKVGTAIMNAVSKRQVCEAGKCIYHMRKDNLICELPSGREMWYPEARIEDVVPPYVYALGLPETPKATATYQGHYSRKSLYGGLGVENASQAITRDIMIEDCVDFDVRNFDPVLTVHDEILCEVPESTAPSTLEAMVRTMSTSPDWATDFPVSCEGFLSPRFVKKPFSGMLELSTKHLKS